MLVTKIWASVLAILATAFLAGMFLLSLPPAEGPFSEADKTATRALTNAGLAAFEADIASSPVNLGPSILLDTRLKEALDKDQLPAEEQPEVPDEGLDLQGTLGVVANGDGGLLRDYPDMTFALVDKNGGNVTSGVAVEILPELLSSDAFTKVQKQVGDGLFSATLSDRLYAVKVSRRYPGSKEWRALAVQPISLGGDSFLRRVLGSENPAGIVREGEMVGKPIGSADPAVLKQLVSENTDGIPPEGASQVFEVGEGGNKRIGAIGRIPGPAGKGSDGALFAVVSKKTAGSANRGDLAQSLSAAIDGGGLSKISWPILGALLVIGLALSFYLPFWEGVTPLRRLANEFNALAEGTQARLFHDTYSGAPAEIARNASKAHEAMRATWEQAVADGEVEVKRTSTGRARATRSTRSVRSTRGTRGTRSTAENKKPKSASQKKAPEAIDLPDMKGDEAIESHSQADKPKPTPKPTPVAPEPADAPLLHDPAPTLSDEVEAGDLLEAMTEPASPPLPPAAPSTPHRSPTPPPEDPQEAYFRGIYDEFLETKRACGEPTEGVSFEKFARKLRKNTSDLRKRPGVSDVKFTVYVKDGKAALKAKVVKE